MSKQQLDTATPPQVALRSAADVMRLKRMGSFHQSRLSFMRVLLRRLKQQNWQFARPVWRIDANGVGVATYSATGPQRTYTLIAFAHDLPEEKRSDRVIAEAWDATFTLFDGIPEDSDLQRLSQQVPYQEAGRIQDTELVLARANRSVRLFEYVRDCLASGTQPVQEKIEPVGYLMRTTAVYGSGKFGAADRDTWADRDEFRGSFQPELLAVWLIRAFTIDLVEHAAHTRAPDTAVRLDPVLRRRLGVGNSTGLGMAPFLLNHPSLLHSWINARETALARVRAATPTKPEHLVNFLDKLARATINSEHWQVEHPYQKQKVESLRADLAKLHDFLEASGHRDGGNIDSFAWDTVYRWAEENLTDEGLEQLVSLMIECHPSLVDDLASTMQADESPAPRIDTKTSIQDFRDRVAKQYEWALSQDFKQNEAVARVWYVSSEKLEPRLGERFEEPIEPYEQPLSPARDIVAMHKALSEAAPNTTLAHFLLQHPQHRHAVRRMQLVEQHRYAEIHDNTIAADMLPIDLLRCKLSFFGANKFDPRSDRWLRITMFQGAPFPDELHSCDPDDLAYPPLSSGSN